MSGSTRQSEILQQINRSGFISVRELAEMNFTSPSTIRRELSRLEAEGFIRRTHGGAESLQDSMRPPAILRRQHNREQKAAAAEKAAALVSDGMTIFIDQSTTVQYMIPFLAWKKDLTVYTSGADTALRLADAHIRAINTGGELFAESLAYVGSVAADTVRKVYFDAMFFSSAGFDEEVISDWSECETVLRRIVFEQSRRRYFLADSTKRGRRFAHILCRIGEPDAIFCE